MDHPGHRAPTRRKAHTSARHKEPGDMRATSIILVDPLNQTAGRLWRGPPGRQRRPQVDVRPTFRSTSQAPPFATLPVAQGWRFSRPAALDPPAAQPGRSGKTLGPVDAAAHTPHSGSSVYRNPASRRCVFFLDPPDCVRRFRFRIRQHLTDGNKAHHPVALGCRPRPGFRASIFRGRGFLRRGNSC
jgi:hypothetical protein